MRRTLTPVSHTCLIQVKLRARGPQVSMGYLNNPDATASTYDTEGFLHTGDLGSIDAEGFMTIHDRLKELIKVLYPSP